MSENVSPNPMRRKLVQTTLVFKGQSGLTIDSSKKDSHPKATKRMNAKKLKKDTSKTVSPIVPLPECPTIDLTEEPVAEVDPRHLDGDQCSPMIDDEDNNSRKSTDSCLEVIEEIHAPSTSKTDQSADNATDENIDEDYLIELKHDCEGNDPNVTAIMTIGELNDQCLSLGLTLNTELPEEEESDDSCEESSGGVTYEVEAIYDSKVVENVTYYWVKWKNYGIKENTWEPIRNLGNCRKLVDEYRHIKKSNDDNKLTIYHNWHKLKGIVEDLVDKKVAYDVMTAVLINFNNIRLLDFHYTKSSVKQMRTALREKLEQIDAVNNVKSVDKRLEKIEAKLNYLIEHLNISKRFKTLNDFFVYFENRKVLERDLIAWENRINNIILRENEGLAIRIENFVDCELPPADFEYIAYCKTQDPNIIINNDPPVYCECTDCESQQDQCCVTNNTAIIAYTKNGILKDSRRNRSAIYECNKKCKCGDDCINRVVQKGRKHKLVVFKTDDGRGWGVRTLEPILKGSYVMEYVGEIITVTEADKRGAIYDAEGRTYLFDLDFTPDDGSEGDQYQYTLDATQCGNVSHFVNHSCDPNLDTKVVWIENQNPLMPHIALFAVKGIKVNEELTFDYKINVHAEQNADQTENNKNSSDKSFDSGIGSESARPARVECRCGAAICRKFLY